jgi:hypothetical protein
MDTEGYSGTRKQSVSECKHLTQVVRNVWNSKLSPLVHLRGMLFTHNDYFIVVSENGTYVIRNYNRLAHFSEKVLYVKVVSSRAIHAGV